MESGSETFGKYLGLDEVIGGRGMGLVVTSPSNLAQTKPSLLPKLMLEPALEPGLQNLGTNKCLFFINDPVSSILS